MLKNVSHRETHFKQKRRSLRNASFDRAILEWLGSAGIARFIWFLWGCHSCACKNGRTSVIVGYMPPCGKNWSELF